MAEVSFIDRVKNVAHKALSGAWEQGGTPLKLIAAAAIGSTALGFVSGSGPLGWLAAVGAKTTAVTLGGPLLAAGGLIYAAYRVGKAFFKPDEAAKDLASTAVGVAAAVMAIGTFGVGIPALAIGAAAMAATGAVMGAAKGLFDGGGAIYSQDRENKEIRKEGKEARDVALENAKRGIPLVPAMQPNAGIAFQQQPSQSMART